MSQLERFAAGHFESAATLAKGATNALDIDHQGPNVSERIDIVFSVDEGKAKR